MSDAISRFRSNFQDLLDFDCRSFKLFGITEFAVGFQNLSCKHILNLSKIEEEMMKNL